MWNANAYRYIIPVNDMGEGSQTIKIISIYSTASGRLSLLTKYLRHGFDMTRKEAHAAIRDLGFTDLIPA